MEVTGHPVGSVYVLTGSLLVKQTTLPAECTNQTTLYIRWLNTNTTSVNGGTTVSGSKSYVKSVLITATAPVAPTNQASFITFVLSGNTLTVGCTPGGDNGLDLRRIIKVNTIETFTNPVDGVWYNSVANSTYTSDEQIVYDGTETSVDITIPDLDGTYFVTIYNYNYNEGLTRYITSAATGNPRSAKLASIHTPTVTNINLVRATTGATIENPNSTVILDQGIFWSTTSGVATDNSTLLSSGITEGGTFTFTNSLSEPFTRSSTIYFRAYVENEMGYSLTDEISFTNVPEFTGTGTWETPANWNVLEVPGANGDATYGSADDSPIINGICELGAANSVTNLTINEAAILTINAGTSLAVSGTITNNAGIPGLVIKSTSDGATGTGSLINSTTGVSATVERWMSGDLWHLISPAATGGETVASFVGATGNKIAKSTTFYGLAPFDEGINRWNYYKSSPDNITGVSFGSPGTGYQVLRAEGAGTGTGDGTGQPRTLDNGTVTFKGTLAAGDVSVSVTRTSFGWNLIGNPYPCALNVSQFLSDNVAANDQNIDPSYYAIYVADISNITDYGYTAVNLSTSPTLELASGEAFFVKSVAGGGTINFTTAMKSPTSDAFKSAAVQNGFNLIAASGGEKRRTTVKYIPQMTAGLDRGWDAGLFDSGDETSFNLFTALVEDNGVDFTIQCLPDNDIDNLVVPVGIKAKQGANIEFSLADVTIPVGYKVFLEDRVNQKFTRLDEQDSNYSVKLTADSNGTGRFYLHTKLEITGIKDALANDVVVIPLPQRGLIRLSGLVNQPAVATVYDVNGRTITTKTLNGVNENEIQLSGVSQGIYLLKIQSDKKTMQSKFSWTF